MFVLPPPLQLPPLSDTETRKPYSKYYYEGAMSPAPETMAQIVWGAPMDPADALLPDQVDALLEPGYLPRESGYCVLPNGVGYAAALTKMPGVTPQANNWWGPWHEQEDLRYKLWCPGSHIRVGPSWAQENVGMGLEDFYFVGRMNPALFGFDLRRVAQQDDIVLIRGSNGLIKPADGSPADRPLPVVVMHYVRKTPEGIEYRSRFWVGLHFLNGKPVVLLKAGERISEERAYGLANHCAHEMATLAYLLPRLYPEFGGTER